jgi:hypothetical protein
MKMSIRVDAGVIQIAESMRCKAGYVESITEEATAADTAGRYSIKITSQPRTTYNTCKNATYLDRKPLRTFQSSESINQQTTRIATYPLETLRMLAGAKRISYCKRSHRGPSTGGLTNRCAQGARLYDARSRAPRRLGFPDVSSGGRSIASMQIAQSPNGPASVSWSGG